MQREVVGGGHRDLRRYQPSIIETWKQLEVQLFMGGLWVWGMGQE